MVNYFYLFDPLCGWCYGAAPKLQKIAQNAPLTLMPTGLFAHTGRKIDAQFAQFAWQNDQRIAALTGQQFSEQYRQQVLGDLGQIFDSQLLIQALTAVQQVKPEQELTLLTALQQARYVDGKNITDPEIIQAILLAHNINVDFQSDEIKRLTQQRINQAQQLANEFDLSGVPHLLKLANNTITSVPLY